MAFPDITRPWSISRNNQGKSRLAIARQIAGTIQQENAALNVTNFPKEYTSANEGADPTKGQAFNCMGLDSVLLAFELGSGDATIAFQPLLLDEDAGLWLPILDGSPLAPFITTEIAQKQLVEVPTKNCPAVLFRVDTVTTNGTPQDLRILVMPASRIG